MQKHIWFGFLIFLSLSGLTFAQNIDVLRTLTNIVVIDGQIAETGILSDDTGTIFIELTKDSFVGSELDDRQFNGSIEAPQIISQLAKPPRGRMREIVSFELFTDRADTAVFVDRYAMLHEKTRLRESILYGDDFKRTSGGQFLTRLYRDDAIGKAALWHYDLQTETWNRIGGITSNSNEPDVQVFSAIIFETGQYTLWDEDPAPEFSLATDPTLVQYVEPSPFPSVITPEPIAIESNIAGDFEQPFVTEQDTVFDQTVPAALFNPSLEPGLPQGLIPAVGLVETPLPETNIIDNTPTDQFSADFLQAVEENTRSAAPLEIPEPQTIENVSPPVGATLPSTGQIEQPINWLNYFVFLILLSVIGGTIYVVRQKPY